jgi:hypothetical protein
VFSFEKKNKNYLSNVKLFRLYNKRNNFTTLNMKKFYSMLKSITTLFQKCLITADIFLHNTQSLRNFVFSFVDFFSWAVSKLLFDLSLYIPYLCSIFCYCFYVSSSIDCFFDLLNHLGFTFDNVIRAFKTTMPFHSTVFVLFQVILFGGICLTSLLLQFPCIQEQMVKKYGLNILKHRGFQ